MNSLNTKVNSKIMKDLVWAPILFQYLSEVSLLYF